MRELVGQGKPFYSSLDKAAGLLRRKVGTGSEFLKELMSIPGVKQAEIAERGLGELLNAPKMTHEQFMAALSAKPAPAIKERILADDGTKYSKQAYDESAHEEYTLPGGENYREMLIKAPEPKYGQDKIMELEAKLRRAPPDKVEHYTALLNKMKKVSGQNEQFPGVPIHFHGEPGILASMRLKDRLVPDLEGEHNVKVIGGGGTSNKKFKTRAEAEEFANVKHQGGYRTEITPTQTKKLLHLEELQSDWHQQGREKGYGKTQRHEYEVIGPNGQLLITLRDKREAEDYARQRGATVTESEPFTVDTGIPDAPFKKNWEEMALKRLIHHAAENGYHGIVVTPGAEQADRYSLAKVLNEIHYDPSTQHLAGRDHQGKLVVAQQGVTPENLEAQIGKEGAQKILAVKPNQHGVHSLVGEDIKVGGEGMKSFYDKKVPNILNGIGKKYGVKTQLGGFELKGKGRELTDEEHRQALMDAGHDTNPMTLAQQREFDYEQKKIPAHYFPITEAMRQDVKQNGIPLYKSGGTVSTH